ncbi:MAG: efflux RND transporter permease subunit [Planctomycetaceae bacterium]|jgi:multidrug efflux pump subunit AcrB|nr:efflux RND transporter permease subunit [Planctomycetaceae bacterium]MCE2813925.1 efflux RND transporter permease subunit [Planctomycetaceae bacterium]
MQLILSAMRRPATVLVLVFSILLAFFLAIGPAIFQQLKWGYPEGLPKGMEVDVFPKLNLPVIYVCQPYGGMDPAQMEGFLTNYYEYHFLYISGIHHVESRNVQGTALMKLFFHPETDMSQAMAETINYVNRSQAFMPPGTVSPFVMRFDTGSVPVGYLVLSSDTRSISEIQDLALFRVRPMFSNLPGVSAPPPFGGSARSIVISVDPKKLQSYSMSPEEIISALTKGNTLSPSGNLPVGDTYPIVPINSVVKDPQQLSTIPIRTGEHPVYIRDIGTISDSADAPAGYALVNGRRAVYILANKRAEASTLSVIQQIKTAIPKMKEALGADGEGIDVRFEFDQSPFVTRAVWSVVSEGLLGAVLVGMMILLFLRDWRSALVVVLNIPLAIGCSIVALWLTGQTINLMTLGGLALAVGILVDEATVSIENIHAQLQKGLPLARAVQIGSLETVVPRLLAMLCILAVFVSSFFMQGAARGMFVPLSLAVGFAMIASYILSSTLVPVLAVMLLRPMDSHGHRFDRLRTSYESILARLIRFRWVLISAYLIGCGFAIATIAPRLGQSIFPVVDAGQFRLRMRGPDGTHIEKTESLAKQSLEIISQELGKENVSLTLGYVGMIHSNFPVNAVYQWSRGPEEAILYVGLKDGFPMSDQELKERLRQRLSAAMPEVRFSFEPSDIVNEVMSFGSPAPIEVVVSGTDFGKNREFAEKLRQVLTEVPSLRDVQLGQSMDYPTVMVNVDREKAGLAGIMPVDVSRALVTATSSSRFVVPNYWADPKSGIAYQVQVEIPRAVVRSVYGVETVASTEQLGRIPLKKTQDGQLLIRDVASIEAGTMPGQFDRYNMKRQVTLTANMIGKDLGGVSRDVRSAIKLAGDPPAGSAIEIRGQIPPMQQMQAGLSIGLILAIVAILLLLTASFQSLRLALVAISTIPAVLVGILMVLYWTRTTVNIQSFIGAIMAIGVAMANAILLVDFSEKRRRELGDVNQGAVLGSSSRLRAVLMTSLAMIAGMIPMALGFGEAGQQNAPLGLAVLGGLVAATISTLLILPLFFVIAQSKATGASASMDPDDPQSRYYGT